MTAKLNKPDWKPEEGTDRSCEAGKGDHKMPKKVVEFKEIYPIGEA